MQRSRKKWLVVITILLILSSGCSTGARCTRHYNKLKALGCLNERMDTIIRYDTLHGFQVDTVLYSTHDIDTLVIDTGGMRSSTIIRWKEKIVSQKITKRDTVVTIRDIIKYRNFEIPVYKIPWYIYVVIGLLIALVLYLIYGLVSRKSVP